MADRKEVATAVASVGEAKGDKSKPKPETVPELVGGEVGAIKKAGHGGEPCPRRRRPFDAPFVGRLRRCQ